LGQLVPALSFSVQGGDDPQVTQLVSVLEALSNSSSLLDPFQHERLLCALYRISLWNTPHRVAHAWLDLLLHLASVKASFLQPCVRHLVDTFAPPPRLPVPVVDLEQHFVPDEQTETVHELAIGGLRRLIRQQPLVRQLVQDTVGARMPHTLQPRHMHCAFIRATLLLAGAHPMNLCISSMLATTWQALKEDDSIAYLYVYRGPSIIRSPMTSEFLTELR
jgi:hypothetical protein